MPLAAEFALERVEVLTLCDVVRFGFVEVAEHLGVVRTLPGISAFTPLTVRHAVAVLV